MLLQGAISLVDYEAILESAGDRQEDAPGYLSARRTLIGRLGGEGWEYSAENGELAEALQDYDAAVGRELAEPLIAWALEHHNAAMRVTGAQLAEVVTLLHRITPRLHALQTRQPAGSAVGNSGSLDAGLYAQKLFENRV